MRYVLYAYAALALAGAAASAEAQTGANWTDDPPPAAPMIAFARAESDMRTAVTHYLQDVASLQRRYPVLYSPVRHARLRTLHEGWRAQLSAVDYDALNPEGRIDYVTLQSRITYNLQQLRLADERAAQIGPLLPFADRIRLLQENRLDRQRADPRASATLLNDITREATALTQALEAEAARARGPVRRRGVTPAVAARASGQIAHLRATLAEWNTFYDGYDPTFTWWVRGPFAATDAALAAYATAIDRHLVGIPQSGPAPISGDPVLAAGLQADLAVEMIPYSPRELIAIGEREFAWIERQMRAVSNEMGFGDDWKAALEHTKNLAPPPGEAPWAIFDIGAYSEQFIEQRDLISMPPLAREVWRLAMQTPERQLINPFFSGGEVTRLSYPHDSMALDDRLMSLRGNTPHFNFPTVQHELIPGHYLQRYMNDRYNVHRSPLSPTPFWREGWALYWEFRLWDMEFSRNDPDKMGMLFWRLHRAGRIVFSLNYQLGNWTPQQAVDFLVDRVGHERANAEAEVRRTTIDAPLYQVAYMIGALQFEALYREAVLSGRMSERDFHDEVMRGGPMPVELVRARILGEPVPRDFTSTWRFYDNAPRR